MRVIYLETERKTDCRSLSLFLYHCKAVLICYPCSASYSFTWCSVNLCDNLSACCPVCACLCVCVDEAEARQGMVGGARPVVVAWQAVLSPLLQSDQHQQTQLALSWECKSMSSNTQLFTQQATNTLRRLSSLMINNTHITRRPLLYVCVEGGGIWQEI